MAKKKCGNRPLSDSEPTKFIGFRCVKSTRDKIETVVKKLMSKGYNADMSKVIRCLVLAGLNDAESIYKRIEKK